MRECEDQWSQWSKEDKEKYIKNAKAGGKQRDLTPEENEAGFEEFQWDKYAELFEGIPGLDLTEQEMDEYQLAIRAAWGTLSLLFQHDYFELSERRAAQVPVAAEDAAAAPEVEVIDLTEEDAEVPKCCRGGRRRESLSCQ